jgi:hypothetical protein
MSTPMKKPPKATKPEPDPDDLPLTPEQTRSFEYWRERDRRYAKPRREPSYFAPRRWRL